MESGLGEERRGEEILEPLRVLRLVVWPIAALAVLAIAGGLYIWRMGEPEGLLGQTLLRLVDLDEEFGAGTWFATLLHAANAAAAATAAWVEHRRGGNLATGWAALAVVFAGMSLDEAAVVHEMLVEPARGLLGVEGGFLYHAWVVPGAAVVAVLGLGFLRFFRGLDRRTRRWLLAGLGLLFGGALGVEMLNGYALTRWGPGPVSGGLVVVEESLELLGVAVILSGVVAHVAQGLRLEVDVGLALTPPPVSMRAAVQATTVRTAASTSRSERTPQQPEAQEPGSLPDPASLEDAALARPERPDRDRPPSA